MQNKINQNRGGALFRIGALIVLLLSSMIIVPSTLLLIGLAIGPLTFFIAAALSLAVYFYMAGVNKKTLRDAYIAAAIVAAALMLSGALLDMSYDGISYQKTAIGALCDGWNPYRSSIESWANSQPLRSASDHFAIWVDHYPRATWYIGASFYALTGNIETGKAYTLLLMAALFLLLSDFLLRRGIRSWQALLVSLLAAVNPITMAQFTSFYNDAFLMLSLFITVILFSDLLFERRKNTFILLFFTLVIATNIKFTGVAYTFIFCLGFFALLLFWDIKRGEKVRSLLLAGGVIFLGVALFALLAGPYIPNLIDHGHPLFPLAGEGGIDIISDSEPEAFHGQPSFVKIFYALFSYSENLMDYGISDPALRIPFTLGDGELQKLDVSDLRIGGFGPFFGPILILSIVVIAVFMIRYFKKNKVIFSLFALNAAVTAGLMLSISESWWARYSGYLYGAVIVAIACLFAALNRANKKGLPLLLLPLIALIALNTALFFPAGRIERSARYLGEIEVIRNLSYENDVSLYFGDGFVNFTGLYNNFSDSGVQFRLAGEMRDDMVPALDRTVFYNLGAPGV